MELVITTQNLNYWEPDLESRYSMTMDSARLLGLCGRVTLLREVSVHQASQCARAHRAPHSTATLFARLRGLQRGEAVRALFPASDCVRLAA